MYRREKEYSCSYRILPIYYIEKIRKMSIINKENIYIYFKHTHMDIFFLNEHI